MKEKKFGIKHALSFERSRPAQIQNKQAYANWGKRRAIVHGSRKGAGSENSEQMAMRRRERKGRRRRALAAT